MAIDLVAVLAILAFAVAAGLAFFLRRGHAWLILAGLLMAAGLWLIDRAQRDTSGDHYPVLYFLTAVFLFLVWTGGVCTGYVMERWFRRGSRAG